MGILSVFRNFLSRPPTDAAAGFYFNTLKRKNCQNMAL